MQHFHHAKQELYAGFRPGTAPLYLKRTVKPRTTWCGRKCLGRPATRHEQLLWFDVRGVDFLLFVVRFLVLMLAWNCGATYIVAKSNGCFSTPLALHCNLALVQLLVTVAVLVVFLPKIIVKLVMVRA